MLIARIILITFHVLILFGLLAIDVFIYIAWDFRRRLVEVIGDALTRLCEFNTKSSMET